MAGKSDPNPEQILEAQEVIKNVHEVSQMLGTDLDPKTLVLSMQLLEKGANPEALAKLIKDVKKHVRALEDQEKSKKREGKKK